MTKVRIAAVLSSALLLGACGDLFDPAAAVVGDTKISISRLEAKADEYEDSDAYKQAAEAGDPGAIKRAYEQETLTRLIFKAVLEPRAEELGIEITSDDIDDALEDVRNDFASQSAYEEALKESGLTLSDVRELVSVNVLEQQVKDEVTKGLEPTDEELREFYTDNSTDFVENRASHIVVADKSAADEISARLEVRARRASDERLQSTFEGIARQESIDEVTSSKGGDLGFFRPGELGLPPIEEAVSQLPIGVVSPPVQSEIGWHVILVTDRKPIPFEEVSDTIADQLAGERKDEAWTEWLSEAYDEANVEVNPRYGSLDEETRQVVDPSTGDAPGTSDPVPTISPSPTV